MSSCLPPWVPFHRWGNLWGFIWKCQLCGRGQLSNAKPPTILKLG